jgi:hypothetical protein
MQYSTQQAAGKGKESDHFLLPLFSGTLPGNGENFLKPLFA